MVLVDCMCHPPFPLFPLSFLSLTLSPSFSLLLSASPSPPRPKKRKLGKNPAVDTSFLPDRDREVMPARQHVTVT